MKKAFQTILLLFVAMAASVNMDARDNKGNKPSRDQLAEVQAQKIAKELQLDENTTKQFVATFTRCQNEIWGSRPKRENKNRDKNATMTDDEAQKIIKARFAHRQQINEIQEKYYAEYSKFLTQRQILRVYDLEKKMMDRMFNERMNRHGKKHHGPGKDRPCPAQKECPAGR